MGPRPNGCCRARSGRYRGVDLKQFEEQAGLGPQRTQEVKVWGPRSIHEQAENRAGRAKSPGRQSGALFFADASSIHRRHHRLRRRAQDVPRRVVLSRRCSIGGARVRCERKSGAGSVPRTHADGKGHRTPGHAAPCPFPNPLIRGTCGCSSRTRARILRGLLRRHHGEHLDPAELAHESDVQAALRKSNLPRAATSRLDAASRERRAKPHP